MTHLTRAGDTLDGSELIISVVLGDEDEEERDDNTDHRAAEEAHVSIWELWHIQESLADEKESSYGKSQRNIIPSLQNV